MDLLCLECIQGFLEHTLELIRLEGARHIWRNLG